MLTAMPLPIFLVRGGGGYLHDQSHQLPTQTNPRGISRRRVNTNLPNRHRRTRLLPQIHATGLPTFPFTQNMKEMREKVGLLRDFTQDTIRGPLLPTNKMKITARTKRRRT